LVSTLERFVVFWEFFCCLEQERMHSSSTLL
jgi:hypothetical protein